MERRTDSYGLLRMAAIAILGLVVIGTLYPRLTEPGFKNLYVHLADALLNGRVDVAASLHDVVVFEGRRYVPFPPMPGVILMPLVALFGIGTKPLLVALAFSVLNVFVLRAILGRLEIEASTVPWVLLAFFLGSSYWTCALHSTSVTSLAQVVAVTCLLLAIHQALRGASGALTGMWLGFAFLSRQLSIYAAIFLCAALWDRAGASDRTARTRALLSFAVTFGACVALYLLYNWLRFGDAMDTGYSHLELAGFQQERVERFGLFHPVYLPFNLASFFLQGPHIDFSAPTYLWPGRIKMDPFGTSLTYASPFVFFAFWARWSRTMLYAAWASIGGALIHMLFYFNNGWVQEVHRFTLDFFPILILLAALGMSRIPRPIWIAAISYSVVLSTVALFVVPLLNKLAKFL